MREHRTTRRPVTGMLGAIALAMAVPAQAQLTMSAVAGRGIGDGRPATAAALDQPTGVFVDTDGALLIADSNHHRVRRVDPGTGIITTLVGTIQGTIGDTFPPYGAQLKSPSRVLRSQVTANLLIAERGSARIREVLAGPNTVDTFAGTGQAGFSGDNGPADAAQLNQPNDVAEDPAGNVYIADYFNHVIRRVDGATGVITTIAGTPGVGGFGGDGGPALNAVFNFPACVLFSGGNLYVCDKGNHVIRQIQGGTGGVSTIAGVPQTGGFNGDGPATQRRLDMPEDLADGPGGSLLIADEVNHRVRQLSAGNLVTLAGNGNAGASPDGSPANSAIDRPSGVAVLNGQVIFAERGSNRVRAISGGTLTTVAGDGVSTFGGDGGPAADATFREPKGVALDAAGNVYVADSVNNRVRRIGTDGIVTTVAGNGSTDFGVDGVPATVVGLDGPSDVVVDGSGRLVISDTNHQRIRAVDTEGTITTIWGNGEAGGGGDGGPAAQAQVAHPTGLTLDPDGNLVLADFGNNRIRRMRADGTVETLAGTGEAGYNGDGIPATQASLNNPTDMAFDGSGNLYIADFRNARVRRVEAATGVITTVAGTGQDASSTDNQPAVLASLNSPSDVAVDGNGNVYIVDSGSNRIRRVTPRGVIDTVAGDFAPGDSGDGGPATAARLLDPLRILLTPNRIYVADHGNGRIRALDGDIPAPAVGGGGPGGGGGGAGNDGCHGSLARCMAGGGPKKADCLLEFQVDKPPQGARVTCTDGDASCDHDTTPGQCTMRIVPCLDVADSRNTKCSAKPITGVQVLKPAGAPGQALAAAFSGVGAAQVVAGARPAVTFQSAVGAGTCGTAADFVVATRGNGKKKGKLLVSAMALTSEKRTKDRDKAVLVCVPAS